MGTGYYWLARYGFQRNVDFCLDGMVIGSNMLKNTAFDDIDVLRDKNVIELKDRCGECCVPCVVEA